MTPNAKARYLVELFTPKGCDYPELIAEEHAASLCKEMLKESLRPMFWRAVINEIPYIVKN